MAQEKTALTALKELKEWLMVTSGAGLAVYASIVFSLTMTEDTNKQWLKLRLNERSQKWLKEQHIQTHNAWRKQNIKPSEIPNAFTENYHKTKNT